MSNEQADNAVSRVAFMTETFSSKFLVLVLALITNYEMTDIYQTIPTGITDQIKSYLSPYWKIGTLFLSS